MNRRHENGVGFFVHTQYGGGGTRGFDRKLVFYMYS
jgi:hypothetical protein